MNKVREQEFEIHKHHRDVQIKHSSYLLAISAAALAFAVQKTSDFGFNLNQISLAIAVLLWALSFISGCIFTRKYLDAYHKNVKFLELFSDGEDDTYTNEEEKEQQDVEKEMNKIAGRAYFFGELQFYSLMFGGGAFLVWHLLEMAART